MTAVIDVRQLGKSFGAARALDGLDLAVQPGQVHGFLGPNGAGKSTTLRVLLGLVRPDAGSVRVFGLDPWAGPVNLHSRLAYVPGDVNLWPNLTGGEVIDFLANLRGGVDHRRKRDLLERFDLNPTKKVRTYSKGNRQKVALVAALACDVELLVLDEPTSGLDPLMELVFQQCIIESRTAGTTVLLSSHILAEVERLCDAVTIIRQGRALRTGTLTQMRRLTRTSVAAVCDGDATSLAVLPGVHEVTRDGDRVRFTADCDALSAVMAHLSALGIRSLVTAPPTLEQLFVHAYAPDSVASTVGGGR